MSTLKTANIEHLDATSPSIMVNAAGGIQVGGALTATTGTFSGNVSVAGVLTYEDVTNIDSVGVITARSGIHVTSGSVGIGTTNPSDKVEVKGTTAAAVVVLSSGDTGLTGNDVIGQINFKDYDANAHAGGDQDDLVNIKAIVKHETSGATGIDGSDGEGYDLTFSTSKRNGSNAAFTVSEALRIDSSGRLLIGKNVTRSDFYGGTTIEPQFQIESAGAVDDNRMLSIVSNAGETTGYPPTLILGKSRSATANGVGALGEDDQLGAISFQGADSTQMLEGASITAFCDAPVNTAGEMGGRLVFSTTPDSGNTPVEKLRITDGAAIIASPNANFYSRQFNFNTNAATDSIQYSYYSLGNINTGTRPGYNHEGGMWMVLGQTPCDNTYRTLLTSFSGASGMFHGYCGDASSRNIFQHQYNITSPGYNVNNLSQRFNNGAWNTGSVDFQIITNGSSYDLQIKATSYYNAANNASFRITFHTYY